MASYLVGGAVRDALLGIAPQERDWVVVGVSAEEMLRLGYKPVGREFPVFLHPDTKEEYALARTERKVAPGHTGFAFHASTDVTLEQDLMRRDLTVNAMAQDEDGRVIDPYGGRADLERRCLRHVSDAFAEDPLRVLRTARFAAQFKHLEFTVAAETMALMARMAASGELDALSPDRVWQETEKALRTPRPDVFFEVLRAATALQYVYPEIENLFGVPQPARWHPEIDTGVHTLMALKLAAELTDSPRVRFAVLVHDLGKATTPAEMLPRHHGHGERSVELLDAMAARLPIPRRYHALAALVARHHGVAHRADKLRPSTILKLILELDGLRQPDRFEEFLLACEADARGRKGLERTPYPQADRLRRARLAAAGVDKSSVGDDSLTGPALGAAIRECQLAAITERLGE